MLVEHRIHLIENLCLDEPVKNKVYELRVALLFQASLCASLKLVETGSGTYWTDETPL